MTTQTVMFYRLLRMLPLLYAIFFCHFALCEGLFHMSVSKSAPHISCKDCVNAASPKAEVRELHESHEMYGMGSHSAFPQTFLSDIAEVRLANKTVFNKFSHNVACAGVRSLIRFNVLVHSHVAKSYILHIYPRDYYIFALRKILI